MLLVVFRDSTWTSDGEYYSEGFFHHQQRVKDGTAQSQTSSSSSGASGGGWFGGGDAPSSANPDPHGYYKTLGLSGLEQSSSSVDVRAAFRRQVRDLLFVLYISAALLVSACFTLLLHTPLIIVGLVFS